MVTLGPVTFEVEQKMISGRPLKTDLCVCVCRFLSINCIFLGLMDFSSGVNTSAVLVYTFLKKNNQRNHDMFIINTIIYVDILCRL